MFPGEGMEGAPCGMIPAMGSSFLQGQHLLPRVGAGGPLWAHFEPTGSVDMKFLSYKTALLLALACVKQVGDLILNFYLYGTRSPS